MKKWISTNKDNRKDHKHNIIIIKARVDYYSKYWKERYKVFCNREA